MTPPIFQLARSSAAVTALLGTTVTRFWAFGRAPQKGTNAYALPYAVWQTVYGSPENYINQRPDMDNWGVQVSCYADSQQTAYSVAVALRDAFEGEAHVTNWDGDDIDPPTGLPVTIFTVEFKTPR